MKNIKTGSALNAHFMGCLLMAIAGWIDTVALQITLTENTAFLTGRIAKLGRFILSGNRPGTAAVILFVIFFIVGAYISAKLTMRGGASLGLLFSAGLIILTSLVLSLTDLSVIAYITLPMSMGSQNAASSMTDINRTTHLTGPVTDIGINLAQGNLKQAIFWIVRALCFVLGVAAAFYFTEKKASLFFLLVLPAFFLVIAALLLKIYLITPVITEAEDT